MKKSILTTLIFLGIGQASFAQIAAEDATGQSTIVNKNSSIAFNITDAVLTANWNNFKKLAIERQDQFLWGLTANVKNNTGLGDLLKAGKITPESKFGGFIGWRQSLAKKRFALLDDIYRLNNIAKKYNQVTRYDEMVSKIIENCFADTAQQSKLKGTIDRLGATAKSIKNLLDAMDKYPWDATQKACELIVRDSLIQRQLEIAKLQPAFDDYVQNSIKDQNDLNEDGKTHKNQSITYFLNGGLNSNSLNFYNSTGTGASLASRFDTVKFHGAFVDLGINYDYGASWTFGISFGAEHFNNIDSLSSTDYTLKTTISQGNDQLISQNKYTAYAGSYVSYDRANLKTDALYWATVSDDYRLVWDVLYTRLMFPLKDSRINRSMNAGTAINFYKKTGKFAAGFYFQSNDVFNGMNSSDNFGKRLSFGIVAKYSFDSIVDRAFGNNTP